MKYAGIGSRQTPPEILKIMFDSAVILAQEGYICSTGACIGADQAFANGAVSMNGQIELCLPWASYESGWISTLPSILVQSKLLLKSHVAAYDSVNLFHPAAKKLKQAVVKLHARNYLIIEGSSFVICWTPEGKETGGTRQGIRVAKHLGIPVYNLGNPNTYDAFIKRIYINK